MQHLNISTTNNYCDYVKNLDEEDVHVIYHNTQYGFPVEDDNKLFERLTLEINQAGLSWNTILIKQDNFRKAYSNFDIEKIANYDQGERERLLNDPGIIRNKLKVDAAIYNAQVILELKAEFGSFKNWLDKNHPNRKEDWIKLFKKTFNFTGSEITKEFLLSIGFINGAHSIDCPIYNKIKKLNPKWMQN